VILKGIAPPSLKYSTSRGGTRRRFGARRTPATSVPARYNTGMEPLRIEATQKPESDKQARKPYVKPAFLYERAFETMALSCGKIGASQAQCKTNKKNS
jgi:hypothetical protein